MGLNIKNTETERLIKELAAKTGESQTAAVTAAVREKLARVDAAARFDRAWAIAEDCARRLNAPDAPKMMEIDDLYDTKTGLPV